MITTNRQPNSLFGIVQFTNRFTLKRFSKITVFLLFLVSYTFVSAQQIHTRFIAENTVWQTEYYIIDSEKDGPVVMITGGIHGNEPAGAYGAEQVIRWPVKRGKLIIVPRANKLGLEQNTRKMPHAPKSNANLNRNFPKGDRQSCSCELSKELWKLVCKKKPGWLIDLHEGYDYAKINSESVGSSVITSSEPEIKPHARSMLKALNTTIEIEEKKFVLRGPPVKGSLARAAADRLNIKSYILETTAKGQPLSIRVRQHQIMLHRLLTNLEMIDFDVALIIKPLQDENSDLILCKK